MKERAEDRKIINILNRNQRPEPCQIKTCNYMCTWYYYYYIIDSWQPKIVCGGRWGFKKK